MILNCIKNNEKKNQNLLELVILKISIQNEVGGKTDKSYRFNITESVIWKEMSQKKNFLRSKKKTVEQQMDLIKGCVDNLNK